nr:RNA-directed DNA polymerase, eukaryota, reverse transcriptase zinc-binding domain protein [Tanacetum cinerariifolium]
THKYSLWAMVIKAIHGDDGKIGRNSKSGHTSIWRDIVKEMEVFKKQDSSMQLSHMFYADDAVFVGQWSDSNIDRIVHVLECFHRALGLRINMSKSKFMGIAMDVDRVEQAALKIGCVILKAPFSYLGSKMKTLSIGRRLTLLKSVLGSIPIYHMSIFKVPMKVLHRMESIRSHFFNGTDLGSKKSIWVKWNNVLASKEKGGLGVSNLYDLNRALMFKWIWLFTTHKYSLWAMVIKAIHGDDGKIGRNSKSDLLTTIEGVYLVSMNDRWVWSLEGSGNFFVASVRKLIDDRRLPDVSSKTRWIKAVLIKISFERLVDGGT